MYEEELRKILQSILNVTLDEKAWTQCTLPVAKGGLGIRLASDVALPAFLSSAFGASSGMANLLTEEVANESYRMKEEAMTLWLETFENEALQPLNTSLQASWDKPLYDLKYSQLLEQQDNPADKARLLAVASEHASD